ncbi:unnamed protein product, partial [Didymodactylos carnosus]
KIMGIASTKGSLGNVTFENPLLLTEAALQQLQSSDRKDVPMSYQQIIINKRKSIEKLEKFFSKYSYVPVCELTRNDVENCYVNNSKHVLSCSNLAEKFIKCDNNHYNDQKQILCGTDTGKIYNIKNISYNKNTDEQEHQTIKTELLGHTKLVSDLCYYDNGEKYILSCSADCDIRLWELLNHPSSTSYRPVTIYRSHLSPVWCLDTHKTSGYFASGSMDSTIRLWTSERVYPLRTFVYHIDDINTVKFHSNGKYLASGSSDGQILLWSINDGQLVRILNIQTNDKISIEKLLFSSDGHYLFSLVTKQNQTMSDICMWDIRTAKVKKIVENIPYTRCISLCELRNENTFVTGYENELLFFKKDESNDDSFRLMLTIDCRLLNVSHIEKNKVFALVTDVE